TRERHTRGGIYASRVQQFDPDIDVTVRLAECTLRLMQLTRGIFGRIETKQTDHAQSTSHPESPAPSSAQNRHRTSPPPPRISMPCSRNSARVILSSPNPRHALLAVLPSCS